MTSSHSHTSSDILEISETSEPPETPETTPQTSYDDDWGWGEMFRQPADCSVGQFLGTMIGMMIGSIALVLGIIWFTQRVMIPDIDQRREQRLRDDASVVAMIADETASVQTLHQALVDRMVALDTVRLWAVEHERDTERFDMHYAIVSLLAEDLSSMDDASLDESDAMRDMMRVLQRSLVAIDQIVMGRQKESEKDLQSEFPDLG